MKKLLAFLFVFMIANSAWPKISSNFTLTSDYVWRGVTQTNHDAAVQGGLNLIHPMGLYLGSWMSNVNLEETIPSLSGGNNTEVDVYAGYQMPFMGLMYLKFQLMAYQYIQDTTPNFEELSVGISMREFFDFVLDYSYDWKGTSSSSYHMNFSTAFEVRQELTLGFGLGYTIFGDELDAMTENYLDIHVALAQMVHDYVVSLNYTDTDRDVYNGAAWKEADDTSFFVSISRDF